MTSRITMYTTVREAINDAAAEHADAGRAAAAAVGPATRVQPNDTPQRVPERARPTRPAAPPAVNGIVALRAALEAGRTLLVLSPTHHLAETTLGALKVPPMHWAPLVAPNGERRARTYGRPGSPLLRLWTERGTPAAHNDMAKIIERMATVQGWVRVGLDDVAAVLGTTR